MTLQEFRRRRLEQAVLDSKTDLLVASLPANIEYLTTYHSVALDVLARTQAYALFAPGRKPAVVASLAEIPSIMECLGEEADLYCFGTFCFCTSGESLEGRMVERIRANRLFDSAAEALSAAIRTSGAKRAALDESHISYPTWQKVMENCPETTLVPGAGIFLKARMMKHEDEIAGLERSVEIAESAFQATLAILRPGVTERELEHVYCREVAELGARPAFFVATAAHRAAFSDTVNTSLAIQKGDMIRFDFGCVYKGYCSDIARTAVIGTPDEKLAVYYEAVRRGTRDAIAAIRPGITTAEEVFAAAVESTRINGLPHYERHHCGHGIGVECYDYPSIAIGDKTVLQPGMVLCIETPYYELGWGGVQLENTIQITETGIRNLDKSGDALIVLEETK